MNEQSVFIAALEREPSDRARFLDQACENNPGLRQRVERLIASHEAAVSFMDAPAGQLMNTVDQPPLESSGTQIGPYKLLQEIGQGGMGVVYMAEQVAPVRRKVALKIIKPGMDTRQVIARFEAERQALSLMDHPNIAKVLDAGTTGTGRPYFVMELVKGQPITKYCDQLHFTPRQRLELFLQVCQAIQHAHQKGIIHRDVKPSNVLVAEYDGRPIAKVIDFGVAKAVSQPLTEKTMFTGLNQIVGTLEYMSPEQARVNQLDVDTRSDIYSLGVLLYELLTGSTPFDKRRLRSAAWDEMLRIIREEEPPRPSTRLSDSKDSLPSISAQRHTEPAKLTRIVRGELDWIVMKALEKDRNRRYETANGLAMDVQRYLNDEAVAACPPSAAYRIRKFARRNKVGLGVTGLLLLFLLLLGSGTAWVIQDRLARRALTEKEVETALQEATRLAGERKWTEAQVWAQRADDAVADGASVELRQRVRDIQSDLKAILRIEEIRLLRSNVQGNTFDLESSDSLYADAFRELGVDVDALDPAQAGQRLQARLLSVELAGALDDWAFVRHWTHRPGWEHLMQVARQADSDPWRNRVREAWQKSDGKALQALAESDEVARMPPAALIRLAKSIRMLVDAERAEAVLRRGQRQHPSDFWMSFELADTLHQVNPFRQDEIIRFVTAAAALRPNSPGIHFSLAYELAASGRTEEAIAEYREAIRLKGDYPVALFNLGTLLCTKGDYDNAIRCLKEVVRLEPQSAHGYVTLGTALRKKGDLGTAIVTLREAIRLKPDSATAHFELATSLTKEGAKEESDRHFRIAQYYEDVSLLNDPVRAEEQFRKRVKTDPTDTAARIMLTRALLRQGKLADAEVEARESICLFPQSASAHRALGEILYHLGQDAEGEIAFREATAIEPDSPALHTAIGFTYAQFGRWDRAAAAYTRSLELDPADHDAWRSAAYARLAGSDVAGYRRACGDLIQRFGQSEDPILAERTAKVCSLAPDAVADFRQVEQLADRALTGTRNHSYYHYFVLAKGLTDGRAGRDTDAVKWLVRFAPDAGRGCDFDAIAFAALAISHYRLGQIEEAHEALTKAKSIVAEKLPAPAKGRPLVGNWTDWVHAQVLTREAEELVRNDENSSKPHEESSNPK